MHIETRTEARTRTWHEEPYGPSHSRREMVTKIRVECGGDEVRDAMQQLQGYRVIACGPDMVTPGRVVILGELARGAEEADASNSEVFRSGEPVDERHVAAAREDDPLVPSRARIGG
jgi:hypothetical protein